MKKRIKAMVLCIVMVISMLPVTVFAAETDNLHHFTKRNDYTSGTFDDVQNDDWFYENVKSVYELGLMQGKGGKQFDPESGVTIAETLTIAARLHSIYFTGGDTFEVSNPWYQVYADYCAVNGITSVNSDTYSQAATRAEFVMILVNALPAEVFEEINKVAANAIPDVNINDNYGASVYKMYRAGIMIGNDDIGTFAPDSEIKRSEVSAIITRMVNVSLRESIQLGNEYTVTFDMNGHGKQIAPQIVIEGYTAEKPAEPTNASYVFKGWYTQKSGGQQFDFNTPITEDITLYACWELNSDWTGDPGWDDDYIPTYTVTFDANGSDVENLPEVQRVKAGECAVEPDEPTKLIHDFGGWYTDSSCTNQFDFSTPITADITLYAKWNISIYSKPLDENHVKTGTLEFEGKEYEGQYVDNELIIVVDEGVVREDVESLVSPYGGMIVGQIPNTGHYQIEFDNEHYSVSELIKLSESISNSSLARHLDDTYLNTVSLYEINSFPYVEGYENIAYSRPSVFEGFTHHTSADFPAYGGFDIRDWYLDYTGTYKAKELLKSVIHTSTIGIIDTGFFETHEDLDLNQIMNYNPTYESRINDTPSKYLTYAHGTHVAGIFGAKNNNGKGITGINDNVNIFAFNLLENGYIVGDLHEFYISGFGNLSAIAYLIEQSKGKNIVINHSLGYATEYGKDYQPERAKNDAANMTSLLNKYSSYNYLIVDAAGNDGVDALYGSPYSAITNPEIKNRIIVVSGATAVYKTIEDGNDAYWYLDANELQNGLMEGAVIPEKAVCFYSQFNYGSRVDILAPGVDIISTVPKTNDDGSAPYGYMMMSGTSQAAPIVTGVASLIWQADPNLSAAEVKNLLLETSATAISLDQDINITTKFVNAESAVIEALGYDLRTKEITFRFAEDPQIGQDSANQITTQAVQWECLSYSGENPDYNINNLGGMFFVQNGDENTTIDIVDGFSFPYGTIKLKFSASGYEDEIIEFTVDGDTDEVIIFMTPTDGDPSRPIEGGLLTGEFVYVNDDGQEIPVAFGKCTLTDITNSNRIYFAEVVDGKLSNASFTERPPVGTYCFLLEGGDKDANGFYSYKLIDTVEVTSDLDMGKVYCDRVADVNCRVTDEGGNALNRVSMTITQNGCEIVRIASFYGGFTIPLQKGTYTLTLTCDGYLPVEKEFTVNGTTDLGVIKVSTATVMAKTMRIRFVDSKSGAALKISDIFEDTSYIGIGHSGLSEGEEFIAGDFIDGGRGTNAFTVNDDKELVFGDVPVIEEMGNYYLIFDSVEKGYLFPNTYTIPSLDLVENAAGEWTAEIELEKVALIVGDVAVTSENALDILGDGTARYDAGSGVLTLTNANITADYVVSTNMDQLTVEIPSGTTTTLTIAPVDYRGHAAAIEARGDLSILGGGTLIIDGDKGVDAICGGYQYSNDEEYELSISDVTVKMPSNNTTGITANRGNLILRNATVLKTGEEDYGHLITGKSIDIIESKIEMISAGTKLIWSAGGDITIVDSVIKLDVDSTGNFYYSIFAEMGAISISGTSTIEIISEETDTSMDYEFLAATNGIQVEDGLLITGGDNVLCEIYQNSSLDSYSVRYKEEEGRYPTMISVAGSSW